MDIKFSKMDSLKELINKIVSKRLEEITLIPEVNVRSNSAINEVRKQIGIDEEEIKEKEEKKVKEEKKEKVKDKVKGKAIKKKEEKKKNESKSKNKNKKNKK